MSASEQGEKQFDPTEQRREQFRKEGKFARSRDAAGVASILSVVGALMGTRAAIGETCETLFRISHGDLTAIARGQSGDVLRLSAEALVAIIGPAILAAALAATVAGLAQTGLHVNLDAIGFKASRLDPISRLKELLSPKHAMTEVLMSVLRVCVVGYVAYRAAIGEVPDLLTLSRVPVDVSVERIVKAASRVVLCAGGAVAAIAIIDYVQSRFRLGQEMKMTRQEVMEEMRQNDGDAKVKGRMKARARALAKKRMLQSVKKADVVVTNPTHVAVALRYNEGDVAPVVVAKGHDDAALRIRTEARKYGIPILENRALARALDAEVQIGHSVPLAHFAAVARILAFVFKLRGRARSSVRRR
jgi:flagellar biosynthetic protein FlhB